MCLWKVSVFLTCVLWLPSMNFMQGEVADKTFVKGDLTLPMVGYDFAADPGRRGATIGIRPEHVLTGELVGSAPIKSEIKVELVEPSKRGGFFNNVWQAGQTNCMI